MEEKKFTTFNAKAEEVLDKASFKNAVKRHRCLVPANHFYEWRKDGPKEKTPFAIGLKGEGLLAFGGVWTY